MTAASTTASSHKQSGDDAFRSGDFSRACTSYASALEALGDGEGDAAESFNVSVVADAIAEDPHWGESD